jgi:hypothetical protein
MPRSESERAVKTIFLSLTILQNSKKAEIVKSERQSFEPKADREPADMNPVETLGTIGLSEHNAITRSVSVISPLKRPPQ